MGICLDIIRTNKKIKVKKRKEAVIVGKVLSLFCHLKERTFSPLINFKNMRQNELNKAIFWDYDLSKANLSNPKVKIWYLTRKLQFGDFSGITKADLKKYLPKLDIDPSLKELLQNYLKSNAKDRSF